MGRTHSKRRQGKEKNAELSKCGSNEGTAARTRPYSYDEIMLNRKNKKLSENAEIDEKVIEMGTATRDIIIKNASNANTSERHEKSSTSGPEKYSYDEVGWRSLRVKEDNLTVRVNSPAIRNDKEFRAPEKRLKSEITKVATENDECRREEQLHSKKRSGRPSKDFRDIDAKRQTRDLVEKDRRVDRVQGRSDRDSQKKHHSGDDHRSKERNGTTNYDIGRGQGAETIGRKERIKSHHEEQRHKQTGSCGRELEENQHIRSDLVSQQGQKHTYHIAHEHGATSHNSKVRPVKHQSDVDEKKIKSNGSSNHRQQSGSTSGLGGYSPRKRKAEASGRIPSPTQRSPSKRAAKWDMAPAGTDKAALASVSSSIQTSTQAASMASANSSVSATVMSLTFAPPSSSIKKDVPVDSVQLTEATRPMRRLYVENLPATATDKTIMEYLNHLLRSSGASYIPGSKPCISCTIHREKGQALVEFLTPEDTKAALLLDGSTFSGSTLKFRRPRDFIEVATGELEKSEVASTVISDTVEDSPHKIFLGGISTALSSEMLMEIASAFGPLKAFHFEMNKNLNEPCAFLEFADHSITGKACAGLNGMKLGGQIITAVQAVPDSLAADDAGSQIFFNIPKLARPLLEKATEVLKLKSLFDLEALSSLSEPEVEEILEDVRLECSRFGSVKSMNIVKCTHVVGTWTETCGVNGEGEECNRFSKEKILIKDTAEETVGEKSGGGRSTELLHPSEGKKGYEKIDEGNSNNEENSPGCPAHQVHQAGAIGSIKDIPNWTEEDPCACLQYHNNEAVETPRASSMSVVSQACGSVIINSPMEISNMINTSQDEYRPSDDQAGDTVHALVERSRNDDLDSVENDRKLQEASAGSTVDGGKRRESDAEEHESNKGSRLMQQIFEPGCVFVEFRRTEASCMAAHCLHGRLFDDHLVTVEYVDVDLYHRQFPK